MTKQEQFLYAVQTAILANAINLISMRDRTDRFRHEISATGVLGTMHDLFWASERIPEDMTAAEAATEFCSYMFDNLRDQYEKAQGKAMPVPDWFARY